METWKPIPGYEGLYEVSDRGGVRSCDRIVPAANRWGAMLKRYPAKRKASFSDNEGYWCVVLYRDGRQRTHRVSRLVLSAFVGAPFPGAEALHSDHDRSNNKSENLHWGTRQENEDEKTLSGRRPASTAGKLTRGDVEQIRTLRAQGVSVKELASKFACHLSNAYLIVKGKTWQV